MEGPQRQESSRCCKYQYMKIAKKMGAELVVYDNVTNDVYMQDLVNGRTDVTSTILFAKDGSSCYQR